MGYSIYQLLGLFLIYSFLGWCTEVSFVALTRGEVVNRGFLNGPVCPIYGVGMIGVLLLLTPLSEHVFVLFLGGMALCSLVELTGGWILERVFDTRWWDYTEEPFNLGGYICLRFSVMWGLAVTFVVKLVHPAILTMLGLIPHTLGMVLAIVLYALFLTDLVMTLVAIIGIKRRIREMERVADALHAVGDTISGRLGNTALAADARLDAIRETGQEKVAEGKEKVAAAIGTGQEKVAAAIGTGQEKVAAAIGIGQEKVAAAIGTGQEKMAAGRQKLETKVTGTMEELQTRRRQLEARQKQLLEEYRGRRNFMVRRLGRAFPAIRQAVEAHLSRMDRE